MPISSFEIISIPVSDQQRAKLFYRDVLGFDLIREEPMGPGMSWRYSMSAILTVMAGYFGNPLREPPSE